MLYIYIYIYIYIVLYVYLLQNDYQIFKFLKTFKNKIHNENNYYYKLVIMCKIIIEIS